MNVISCADMIFFPLFFFGSGRLCLSLWESTRAHTHTHEVKRHNQAYTQWETGLSIIASAAYQALLPGADKQAPCAQSWSRWSGWFAAVWECYRWLSLGRRSPVSVNTWHITCKMSHCVVREGVSGQLVVPIDPAEWVLFYFHFWVRRCRIGVS